MNKWNSIWTNVRSDPHFLLYSRLAVYVCFGISAPSSVSVSPSISYLLCLSLSLSPWPVWSVIEGAVVTWPTGKEGTLCAPWRQIALLAPLSLYLSFTSLALLSSYSAHPLTTLLVSPLYHLFPLPSHPTLISLSYSTILQLVFFNRFKMDIFVGF